MVLGAGDGSDADLGRAGRQQHRAAGFERGPGGEHVVDYQDAAADDVGGVFDLEDGGDVFPALGAVLLGLGLGVGGAAEGGGAGGYLSPSARPVAKAAAWL